MNRMKYRILLRIHESTIIKPVRRKDFYRKTRKINQYKRSIDELIERKYLSEAVGSGKLSITSIGVEALEDEQERRWMIRWDAFRYAVTTAIALIAIVISIISLFVR